MIPSVNGVWNTGLEFETMPSRTYKMNAGSARIAGYVSDLEAMRQVVYQILMTERYQYAIYSWNYGVELRDLIGRSADYVCAELPSRIEEALLQDDRIEAVDGFEFDVGTKREIVCSFEVHTVFGTLEAERQVMF